MHEKAFGSLDSGKPPEKLCQLLRERSAAGLSSQKVYDYIAAQMRRISRPSFLADAVENAIRGR